MITHTHTHYRHFLLSWAPFQSGQPFPVGAYQLYAWLSPGTSPTVSLFHHSCYCCCCSGTEILTLAHNSEWEWNSTPTAGWLKVAGWFSSFRVQHYLNYSGSFLTQYCILDAQMHKHFCFHYSVLCCCYRELRWWKTVWGTAGLGEQSGKSSVTLLLKKSQQF